MFYILMIRMLDPSAEPYLTLSRSTLLSTSLTATYASTTVIANTKLPTAYDMLYSQLGQRHAWHTGQESFIW